MTARESDGKRLPGRYYLIACAGEVLAVVAGMALGVLVGWNPYISGSLAGGIYALTVTWRLKRKGY